MSDLVKPDTEDFRQFFKKLAAEPWVRNTERKHWPRFAFHYTDLRNALTILNEGYLHSRAHLERFGLLLVSSGDPGVLQQTNSDIKDTVRFYFRPKTPTQFYAEGVKSRLAASKGEFGHAHCPVPVFFLFDLVGILSLPQTSFSDCGLGARKYNLYRAAQDLEKLDWAKIYHNGPIPTSDPDHHAIVACRNAEVVVPQSVSLDYLKYVYCRSEPELETLLYLLPSDVVKKYRNIMYSSASKDLYNREQTYLAKVQLSAKSVICHFSPETKSPGPFVLRYEFGDANGVKLQERIVNDYYVLSSSGDYRLELQPPTSDYTVRIFLDDAIIYANHHEVTLGYY